MHGRDERHMMRGVCDLCRWRDCTNECTSHENACGIFAFSHIRLYPPRLSLVSPSPPLSLCRCMDLQPHINEVLLHEVIKYELTQVNNLKDMLQQRDLMIKSHEKTVRP